MTLRGTTSMTMGACIGLKETLAANRPGGNNHDHYPLSPYFGKSFFEGENYRAALERLDGGKKPVLRVYFFSINFLSSIVFSFKAMMFQWISSNGCKITVITNVNKLVI